MSCLSLSYSFSLLSLTLLPLRYTEIPALTTTTETTAHGNTRPPLITEIQQPTTLPNPTQAKGKDGGATGAFTYSTNPTLAATQRVVKGTIETYQKGLNSSSTKSILPLFAPNAVVEWQDKPTVVGRAALAEPYRKLFQISKFTTIFQYDAVDIYNDMALVRTHHLKGQTEQNLKTGAKKLDFNRELFILKKTATAWNIIFYSFNTQPRQGEQ